MRKAPGTITRQHLSCQKPPHTSKAPVTTTRLELPEGTPKKRRKAFERRLIQQLADLDELVGLNLQDDDVPAVITATEEKYFSTGLAYAYEN